MGDFVGRELIRKRLGENKRVALHEFLYPVMQGYDSYFMDTDLQLGGTDQTFNMQAGRTLIKDIKRKDSFVLATSMLEGTDGRKMSKSWGNAIWLDDVAVDMYRKVMAIKDDLIIQYFTLATSLSLEEIRKYEQRLKKENPINIKKELAYQIVKELHNTKLAEFSQNEFEKVIQNKEVPKEIETLKIDLSDSIKVIDIVARITKSRSEAKRLLDQNGISIDEETIKNSNLKTKNGQILKIGKRRFVKLVIK